MLHGSETWPVRKENEVILQRAEMRKVRWMCDVKVKDGIPSKGLSSSTLCLKKNVLTLKRYSSKLQGAILMKFGRNIQNTLE